MSKMKSDERRKIRSRISLRLKGKGRLRLSVHRTNKNLYAQIIDDQQSITLAAASTLDPDLKTKASATVEIAKKVGELIAKRALKAGVKDVVFDRGKFIYHGQVKALAEAAREAGLNF
jgi:large subunit ribosomal protein L18